MLIDEYLKIIHLFKIYYIKIRPDINAWIVLIGYYLMWHSKPVSRILKSGK